MGIAHATHDHPPVFTVAQSAHIKLTMPGGHTKNLFLNDKKGRLFLVSALAETKIDLSALSKVLGVGRFSFGAPDLLLSVLGVTPGAVTAFAVINDPLGRCTMILDIALMAHDPVNFHPLTNDATTAIHPQDLVRFLVGCGHPPQFVAFDESGAPALVDPPG
jgi:Ala-tRNA(Pro) deacylase